MEFQTKFAITVTIVLIVVTVTFGVLSCEQFSRTEESKDIAVNHNETRFTDTCQANDAQFLVDAALINYHEIALGQLANAKTKTPEILLMAQTLVDEHTKSMIDLKLLADKKNVTLPASAENDPKEANNKLLKLKDTAFDKAYSTVMVDEHEIAITKFENAIKNVMNDEIRDWASLMLPSLKMHLADAIKCQQKFSVK